jgi:transcriptional regulator with GAF, ATPase, and Fis domain
MPHSDHFHHSAWRLHDADPSHARWGSGVLDEAFQQRSLTRNGSCGRRGLREGAWVLELKMTAADQDRHVRRFEQIIGNSPALRVVLEQVERVAAMDTTVLIQGETGTGKELIAHAIHNASPRSGQPLIKLNCAAIPFDLLESELFGHERGAFTGAITQRIGRFELADKGTLFLDEVGDMPLALQPKLLRVLQEQEFERLGSGRTHRVNVRLIAATHRDLERMVNCNELRSDLYYRLNVFPIALPPLRDRREDIAPLLEHYVELFCHRMGKSIHTIPEEFVNACKSYSWPGNIRELQNVIERAVILSNEGLFPNLLRSTRSPSIVAFPPSTTLREAERTLILGALEGTGWLVGGPYGAAARLGMKRTTLIARMKKHRILRPPDENRNRAVLDDSPSRSL